MNTSRNDDRTTVIFIRGLPGSGKTYLANLLKKALGDQAVVMLDPDATDYDSPEYLEHTKNLTAEGVDPKLHAYRFLRAKAYDAIGVRQTLIWNQPFTNLEIFNKMVERLRTHAAEQNVELDILVVEVNLDPQIAKERVTRRKQAGGHGPSDATFTRFVEDYHTLANDGYNTVAVTGDDAPSAVSKILSALSTLPTVKE